VPGWPMDPRHAGSNSLIRDGAILVRDANDIISVFGMPQFVPQAVEKATKKKDDTETAKVLEGLGSVPTAVDELVRRCQVSAATVAEVLLVLELEGRLERHRGNRVSLM
jgi:DNA processing protein